MAVRSWRGVMVGVVIALALPIVYLVVAQLVSSGILPFTRTGLFYEVFNSLGFNAAAGFVLAMVGIVTAGRAARLESPWAWLTLLVIALPLLAFAWFISYATLGGALGNPF
ncbi:MAG: hypothetical protein ABI628_10865 [Chloroflexota bacterium]